MRRCNLVPILWPESPRKSALRSIATCARNMGVHTPHTIQRISVGMRKTEKRNPILVPLRKAVKNPIPQGRNHAVEQEAG
jgi:hypothetical protein